jgi:hypothetical protein
MDSIRIKKEGREGEKAPHSARPYAPVRNRPNNTAMADFVKNIRQDSPSRQDRAGTLLRLQ